MKPVNPQALYDAIEDAWKSCSVSSMVLAEITSGRQNANPEAFTFEAQKKSWDEVAKKLRFVLDGLSDMKSEDKAIEKARQPK